MNPALLSSENMNFRTPPEFLSLLQPFGRIALDPATDAANPTNARGYLTVSGLTSSWKAELEDIHTTKGPGFVYINPPYGRHLAAWSRKFVEEGDRGCELLTLTPARTDTAWFRRMRKSANAVCLLDGRLKFWSQVPSAARGYLSGDQIGQWRPGAWNYKKNVWSNAAAPFPCAVMYWGARVKLFNDVFGSKGWVIR